MTDREFINWRIEILDNDLTRIMVERDKNNAVYSAILETLRAERRELLRQVRENKEAKQ